MATFEILGLTLYIEYKMSSNLIIWKLKIIVQNIFVWKLSVSFVQQYSILLEHTTLFFFSNDVLSFLCRNVLYLLIQIYWCTWNLTF